MYLLGVHKDTCAAFNSLARQIIRYYSNRDREGGKKLRIVASLMIN